MAQPPLPFDTDGLLKTLNERRKPDANFDLAFGDDLELDSLLGDVPKPIKGVAAQLASAIGVALPGQLASALGDAAEQFGDAVGDAGNLIDGVAVPGQADHQQTRSELSAWVQDIARVNKGCQPDDLDELEALLAHPELTAAEAASGGLIKLREAASAGTMDDKDIQEELAALIESSKKEARHELADRFNEAAKHASANGADLDEIVDFLRNGDGDEATKLRKQLMLQAPVDVAETLKSQKANAIEDLKNRFGKKAADCGMDQDSTGHFLLSVVSEDLPDAAAELRQKARALLGNGKVEKIDVKKLISSAAPPKPPKKEPKKEPQKEGAPPVETKEKPKPYSETNKLREQYDDLKIKTMSDMVSDVDIPIGDATTKCKFLYLTNSQAKSIAVENMPKVREELDLADPMMVIRLMPSTFGQQWWEGFPHWAGRFPAKSTPELSDDAEDIAERQMLLLAKNVILPFAVKTKALVLGQEGCSLTTAFLRVSSSMQKQMKSKCPFRVLIFASAYYYYQTIEDDKNDKSGAGKRSTVRFFWDSCEAWKDKDAVMKEAVLERYGDDMAYWPRFDLVQGRFSLIMFECLKEGSGKRTISDQTPGNFMNDFISSLRNVPAIAVQTYGTDKMKVIPTMAEHVSRGSSLLLVDSRDRGHRALSFEGAKTPEEVLERAKKVLEEFSEQLHAEKDDAPNARGRGPVKKRPPLCDWYTTSVLAFVKMAVERIRDLVDEEYQNKIDPQSSDENDEGPLSDSRGEDGGSADDPSGSPSEDGSPDATGRSTRTGKSQWKGSKKVPEKVVKGRKKQSEMWLHEAILDMRKRKQRMQKVSLGAENSDDKEAAKARETINKLLVSATNLVLGYAGGELEWEFRHRHSRFLAGIEQLDNAKNAWALADALDHQWLALRGCVLHKFKEAEQIANVHKWLTFAVQDKDLSDGKKKLTIDAEGLDQAGDFEYHKKLLTDMLKKDFEASKERDMTTATRRVFMAQEDKWMAVYEILKSETVQAASIHDLKDCDTKLNAIAKIDYLPDQNTLEALVLIRRAWTLHDVFTSYANFYKRVSKLTTLLLLCLGVLTVVAVTIEGMASQVNIALPSDWNTTEKYLLLCLSLSGSLVTGFVSLVEPSRKWFKLRGGALRLESEIWKFRTRMGAYQSNFGVVPTYGRDVVDRQSEAAFKEMLASVQEKVSGAGLKRTRFYSNPTTVADSDRTLDTIDQAEASSFVPKAPEEKQSCWRRICCCCCPARCCKSRNEKLEPRFQPVNPAYIKHGQFPVGSEWKPKEDDQDNHHSPQMPDGYIRFRLTPLRNYYQSKIPSYARYYRTFQVILLLSSVSSALISAVVPWRAITAIIAAFAGAVSAWQEFTAVEKKLDRYSGIANALENMLMTWQALPNENKKTVAEIDRLIMSTENLVAGEQAAWMSDTQQAAKKIQQQQKQQQKQQLSGGAGGGQGAQAVQQG